MLGRQHRPLGIDKVREYAEIMEAESKRFYLRAARHSNDAAIRQLLGDLAAEARRHEAHAGFFAAGSNASGCSACSWLIGSARAGGRLP